MAMKPKPMSNVQARKMLERDVAEFLEAGNKIQQIASGVSGQDSMVSGRRHLVLGQTKKPT